MKQSSGNPARSQGHSRKKLDLAGRRFGKLLVLRPAENIGQRTAWLCQCDCGRQIVVRTDRLCSGHTASCGCSNGQGVPLKLTYIDGTCVEMLRAKTVRRNNTSGVPGVDWRASKRLWRAAICFKGKRYYLGSFASFEEAVQARKKAEDQLHNNFLAEFAAKQAQQGEFAADS